MGKVRIEEGLLYLFWSLRIGSLERFRRREMLVTGHLSEMPMGQQIHRPETTPSGSRDISLSPNMVPIWFPTNMVHNMVANMVPNMVLEYLSLSKDIFADDDRIAWEIRNLN